MALQDQLNHFYQNIESVSSDKCYWLVRTHAGKQYPTYKSENCIGLGFEKVSLERLNEIDKLNLTERQAVRMIKPLVQKQYPLEKQPALIAHHLYWFAFKIKQGDIVVIPSKGSKVVLIGEVKETKVQLRNTPLSQECPYHRVKTIEWQKEIRRVNLEPALARMLFSHNRITHITQKYGTLIEAVFANYFVKDEKENTVFTIGSKEPINARELFELGHHLLYVTGDFAKQNKLHVDFNDLSVKVNLNTTSNSNTTSNLKFSCSIGNGTLLLAVLSVFLDSEGVRYTSENTSFKSGGKQLIQQIQQYKNKHLEDRIGKSILESFHSMQIKTPVDAVELIRQFAITKEKAV